MIVRDIQKLFEEWAPSEIAWETDNVGLQVGSYDKQVQKILIALDPSEEVIDEAVKKNIDLIVTHHPLIFEPLKSVISDNDNNRLVYKLVQSGISLFSAHTNLDFTANGVSYALAKIIELQNVRPLKKSTEHFRKISVFVPSDYVEKITEAMAISGAGIIGNYEYCSFRTSGVGTFKGGKNSKPFIGAPGEFEKVDEVRLEMIVPFWKVSAVINNIRTAHPYEEPAFDIYPLQNEDSNFGAGAIGQFEEAVSIKKFLQHIKDMLDIKYLKFTEGNQDKIKTVAVCGGSGSNMLSLAISSKADAFITGDIGYHTFQQAKGKILLIDAGHYETEIPIIESISTYLQNKFAAIKENIQIKIATELKQHIQYF
jgi:dinuclear metal center YbgI/SA1388 family protein